MEEKKTYNMSTSVKGDILYVDVTGDIRNQDMHKVMIEEIIDIDKSTQQKKQLVDITKLKGRFEIFELYNLVRHPERPIKTVALIDIPENASNASFHETTAFNAGFPLKWFTDIDKAKAWLESR